MKNMGLSKLVWGGVLGALGLTSVHADEIRVSLTVDNSYALFVGNLTSATTFVGSDGNWPTTETYNFTLSDGDYLYVVTASDKSTAQGFLGQFNNITNGYTFYSQNPQWQVMATGLGTGAPYTGSSADLALLTAEIQDANAGGNASKGWQSFTAGGANGASPWGARPNIDAAASWVWYAAGNCNVANPTQGGCDAGEWLVFRIAVGATPSNPVPSAVTPATGTVPVPGTLLLAGLGLGLIAGPRRKKD